LLKSSSYLRMEKSVRIKKSGVKGPRGQGSERARERVKGDLDGFANWTPAFAGVTTFSELIVPAT
ncbi:MAG: hypothetical protein NTV04_07230, partial [Deltaproteobacteria bacterium]|nr:hypothetical protein [Deltaproteobacteria bacterium]